MPAKGGSGGGGSGASDIRAGGAEYELKLRDKMTSELAKAQEGVKNFAKAAKQHMAPLAGAMGQIFNAAGTGGVIGVGVAVGQKLLGAMTDSISEAVLGTKSFQKELDRAVAAAGALSTKAAEIAAATREWAAAATTPGDRGAVFSRMLEEQQEMMGKLMAERKAAVAEYGGTTGGRGLGLFLTGGLDDARGKGLAALKAIDAEIAKVHAGMAKMAEESRRIADPLKDPGFVGAVNKLGDAMSDARWGGALEGFSEQVRQLEKQHGTGGTGDLFGRLFNEAAAADAAVRIRAATKALTDYTLAQAKAGQQALMTASEFALMNAAAAGVDAGTIADAQARLALLDSNMGGGLAGLGLGAAIGEAIKMGNVAGQSVRGGFVTPGAIASQMFGGQGGNEIKKAIDKLAAGKTGLADEIAAKAAEALSRELRTR